MKRVKFSFFLLAKILLKQCAEGGVTNSSNPPAGESSNEHTVIVVKDQSQFEEELEKNVGKLIVVQYTATWCRPCQQIAPFFGPLPITYPAATFLECDPGTVPTMARAHGVGRLPTFVFLHNKKVLDVLTNNDQEALEAEVRKWIDYVPENMADPGVPGFVNLMSLVDVCQSKCVNDSEECAFKPFLRCPSRILESDIDPQLVMSFVFTRPVRLHSLKMKAPTTNGPQRIKLFSKRSEIMNPVEAEKAVDGHELMLSEQHLEGELVQLSGLADFEYVTNLQIFVNDNQVKDDITRIDNLILVGLPIDEKDWREPRIVKTVLENAKERVRARGHIDLRLYVDVERSQCVNDDEEFAFENFIVCPHAILVSDEGPQLIMSFAFTRPVEVHSLIVNAPTTSGPKRLKLFTYLNMDAITFNDAENLKPNEELMLSKEQLKGEIVDLDVVNFQKVQNLQIFVSENQDGGEMTRIDSLALVGVPIDETATNENRVAFEVEREVH